MEIVIAGTKVRIASHEFVSRNTKEDGPKAKSFSQSTKSKGAFPFNVVLREEMLFTSALGLLSKEQNESNRHNSSINATKGKVLKTKRNESIVQDVYRTPKLRTRRKKLE